MDIGINKTVSGRYQIVDESDEDAPLIRFYNNLNKPEVVEKVFKAVIDYYTEQALKENSDG